MLTIGFTRLVIMPRILFVSAHCPHGPAYGARLRTRHIARILKRFGTVGMVLIPYEKVDGMALQRTRDEFDLQDVLYMDRQAPRGIMARVKREIDPYYAFTEGVRLGTQSSEILDDIVRKYDLIWFQGISIPNSLGRQSWPCSVLDIDDVPSQVLSGADDRTEQLRSRVAVARKAMIWRRRERVLLNRFGIVSVCSEQDKFYLGGSCWIHPIPNGFEAPSVEPTRFSDSLPLIGFIGTLRYGPNIEGMRWFIREVWPLVKAVRNDVRLRLVGLDTENGIASEGHDIDGLGFLGDATSEIAGWAASIVPIHRGGGTRIKIAEAFSRKCPVISTTLGAYGYQVESGRDCLVADSPAEMAEACLRLLADRELGEKLANHAWQRFNTEWSWEAIAPRISNAIEACLGRWSNSVA